MKPKERLDVGPEVEVELDNLHSRMQTPEAREAVARALASTPAELAETGDLQPHEVTLELPPIPVASPEGMLISLAMAGIIVSRLAAIAFVAVAVGLAVVAPGVGALVALAGAALATALARWCGAQALWGVLDATPIEAGDDD